MKKISKAAIHGKRSLAAFSPYPTLAKLDWRRYQWILHPVLAFLITRLVIFGAAIVGDVLLPTDPGHSSPVPGNTFLNLWAKSDSLWYNSIIREGYWFRPEQKSNVAFFPLYPLVVSTLTSLLGINSILTSAIVSNVAFLAALLFLYKITDFEFDDEATAQRTVYYLAIFPTSFFFSSMYTESMFLAFSVATVYFARRQLWMWTALMGLLAAATRNMGALLWGLVMWEWLRVHGWTAETIHRRTSWMNLWRALRRDWFQVLILAVVPLGLISYMAFLHINFEDPVAFVTTQSAWERQNVGPWVVVTQDLKHALQYGLNNKGNILRLLNISTMLGVLPVSLLVWKRLGAGYAIYTMLLILIPASSASQSIIRYVLACFPVFMMLGALGRNIVFDKIVTTTFAVLLGVLTTVFANWFFVA